ncbi:MAG TPA: hypothetical protein VMW85_01850 [Methanomassiliicoccales archaeon]|nr:hypothetical protein [Methanomassiliicoccales archaeon]
MDESLVTIVNLLLCLVIMAIGLLGYRRSRHALPMILALVFGLFGLSHALVLIGISSDLEPAVFIIRGLAYGLVIYLLYRYVRVLDIF